MSDDDLAEMFYGRKLTRFERFKLWVSGIIYNFQEDRQLAKEDKEGE